MKKFLSIIMVLAMVISLGVTAFAAENTGSITIMIDKNFFMVNFLS